MMCEHDMDHLPFTGQKHCRHCGKSEQKMALETALAAANARVAELEQQKPSYKAEFDCVYEKLKAEEVLSKHYKQRAEQAEARCAEIATAYQNMKGDFEHWAYCELIDSPPGKKCTCGVWELVAAIKAALEGKP